MKLIVTIFIIFSFSQLVFGQDTILDYRNYHKRINVAEELIFMQNDSIAGLLLLDSVFQKYDFVFVDDCIEAFQLAILYKRDDLALKFIKKAIDNGFLLENMIELNCGCPHNFYKDISRVTIIDDFINKNKIQLEQYQKKVFAEYIKRINKPLLQIIINRHITEQIYKNYIYELGISEKENHETYLQVSDDNIAYIVSQFKNKQYIGEKNIGIINKTLLKELGIKYLNDKGILDEEILKKFKIPKDHKVPVIGTGNNDYFGASPLYIMLYHNKNSFEMLAKYKDEAIREGYLHPREYASLKLKGGSGRENRVNNVNMKLATYFKEISNSKEINCMREENLLPKYEVDLRKHEIAHKYCLKLFFGFFNGTR